MRYYIKGDEYTPEALAFLEANPFIHSDEDLVREGFCCPDEKDKVWTQESISVTWLKLITSYCLIVIFFCCSDLNSVGNLDQ